MLAPKIVGVLPSAARIGVTGTSRSDGTPLLADPFFRQFFGSFAPLPQAKRVFQAAVAAAAPGDLIQIEFERQSVLFCLALPLRPGFWPSDTR